MIVSVVDCVMGISSQSDNLNRMSAEDDESIHKTGFLKLDKYMKEYRVR